jgi:hypothetical protein
VDAVAVLVDLPRDLGVGAQRGRQNEANFPLLKDVRRAIAAASLRPGVGHQLHAEGGTVEIRCLAGVAHEKLDVVRAS